MVLPANAERVVFARDEEGLCEPDRVVGVVEGVACASPALGLEEGVGIHCRGYRVAFRMPSGNRSSGVIKGECLNALSTFRAAMENKILVGLLGVDSG